MPNPLPEPLEQRLFFSGVTECLTEPALMRASATTAVRAAPTPLVAAPALVRAAKPDPRLTQAPNRPIGVARGIHPGRVVWTYDPAATPWDGRTGRWWDDAGTNQAAVSAMMSRSLRALTGARSDAAAWNSIFSYYNRTHGRGKAGYRSGEKIAIKINLNNTISLGDTDNQIDASPQSVFALVEQLVTKARVPQQNITLYDAVRPIPDRIYLKVHSAFPRVRFVDRDGGPGRARVRWTSDVIDYAIRSDATASIPTVVKQATYLINMALLKGHRIAGVTLTAKNHYGSIAVRDHHYIQTAARPVPIYSPLVDLAGHKDLGGKTVLFMIDALYGANDLDTEPIRWRQAPFNDRWTSSFFLSQDPVAIDSVGADFLLAEFGHLSNQYFMKNADNYLHEAATANSPASGTIYQPNGNGRRLSSLGVHEHWNNVDRKQYSRNLSPKGRGIELFSA